MQATKGGGSLVVGEWKAPLKALVESANLRVPFSYYSSDNDRRRYLGRVRS